MKPQDNAPGGEGPKAEQGREEQDRADAIRSGIRQGMSLLGAMRDAIEETLNEARERGDLSPERAKDVIRSTLERAQNKAGEAREAFDFVRQKEFDGLEATVDGLKERLRSVERSLGLEVEEEDEVRGDTGPEA